MADQESVPGIVIVTPDQATGDTVAAAARAEGFEAARPAGSRDAMELLRGRTPAVAVCDLDLPGDGGGELLRELEGRQGVEIVMLAGNATVESAVDALRRGATDYLTKPVDVERLRHLLRRTRQQLELRHEVVELRRELRELGRFGPLVGSSAAMQRVYDLIERVAPTEVTVLLVGPSGTGKELVAQTIHRLSERARGPFVPLNCGAVASQLIESELFGHERGAFTGAERRHAGVFERAEGGTLLLDEITEMSPDLQVRLLRVLETDTIRRVGGNQAVPIDVRVIAATNRDPEVAVADGRLREDLYYRLKVFPIRLPELAAREGDVERLALAFLERLNRASGRRLRFAPEALEALQRYDWPGNVRELWHAVERASILADDRITAEMLPAEVLAKHRGGHDHRVAIPPGLPLDEVVRQHTLTTLEHLGGNKRRTARALGISVKTLYNRLDRYQREVNEG